MMDGCVGGGGSSLMMSYGDNNSTNGGALCPTSLPMVMMMPPQLTSSHQTNSDTLFLPLPPLPSNSNNNTNHHQDSHLSRHTASSSSYMMLDDNTTTTTNHQNLSNTAGCYFMENDNDGSSSSVKAKIIAHPHYHRLLAAYVNCQKIGAPPEVVARLEEACSSMATMGRKNTSCIGEDPALDQFMVAYIEMLTNYEQEHSKVFKEAMLFLSRVECQLKARTLASADSALGETMDRNGWSEEDVDVNNSLTDPQAEDREVKGQLLRKYSEHLGSLKQEFMKKKRIGRLPKEAKQQLLDWWSRHDKWPYPLESQKRELEESTGLERKQIDYWFKNQRTRHWKHSEDTQLAVVDAAHPHYYMENVLDNPFPMNARWNPTPEQLQTLEELYRRGTRTPSAEEIVHITAQLRRYGKIEGKNVFYWFQNYKARERQKRRRQLESTS